MSHKKRFLPLPPMNSLTTWTLYSRQQTDVGTCYVVARAYSLEQQNAGRAHDGLCHASSFVLILLVILL